MKEYFHLDYTDVAGHGVFSGEFVVPWVSCEACGVTHSGPVTLDTSLTGAPVTERNEVSVLEFRDLCEVTGKPLLPRTCRSGRLTGVRGRRPPSLLWSIDAPNLVPFFSEEAMRCAEAVDRFEWRIITDEQGRPWYHPSVAAPRQFVDLHDERCQACGLPTPINARLRDVARSRMRSRAILPRDTIPASGHLFRCCIYELGVVLSAELWSAIQSIVDGCKVRPLRVANEYEDCLQDVGWNPGQY